MVGNFTVTNLHRIGNIVSPDEPFPDTRIQELLAKRYLPLPCTRIVGMSGMMIGPP